MEAMTRIVRRTLHARYVRKTLKLELTQEERTFLEAAVLLSRAADDSVIQLKEIACPNCQAIAGRLHASGVISMWKNDGDEGWLLTLGDAAEREVTQCLTTRV